MKNTLFWHDLEDLQAAWAALRFIVKADCPRRPDLYLRTGTNARMTLVLNDYPLFWATLTEGHYGAWLVQNAMAPRDSSALIPAIASAQVERFSGLSAVESIKGWCRYFVKCLDASGFLYSGEWLAQALMPNVQNKDIGGRLDTPHWNFAMPTNEASRLPDWRLSGATLVKGIEAGPVQWIDFSADREALILLHDVDPQAGRLKWWRKKASEGTLPPILLWYVAGIGALVVVDGHYRLRAAIMENSAPRFVVICASQTQAIAHCADVQQRVLASLTRQIPRKPARDIATINRVVIDAFDDRPFRHALTHAWASLRSERDWNDEVGHRLRQIGKSKLQQKIADRSEPDSE